MCNYRGGDLIAFHPISRAQSYMYLQLAVRQVSKRLPLHLASVLVLGITQGRGEPEHEFQW